jgi:hypothetical protein
MAPLRPLEVAPAAYRSTFLKKRMVSTVFDEVEGRLVDAGDRRRLSVRALGHLGPERRPGGEGGAVKAGPSGPPGGEALTAPVAGCRQPPSTRERRQAFPVASGPGVDTAVTSPLAPRTGRGRPWGFGCRTFLRSEGLVHGVFPATARRAALSSPASPDGGQVVLRARALAVSEPCSTGLLVGEAADLAVPQPLEHQAE